MSGEFGADVGASGVVKACYGQAGGHEEPKEFEAAGEPELGPALRRAADKLAGGRGVTRACVAVAGRVRNGACRLTHVDWPDVTERSLAERLGAPVRLVNDLAAHARHVAGLYESGAAERGVRVLHPRAAPGNVERVVAVGMGAGLGIGRAFRRGDAPFEVYDSEGGHARFGPAPGPQDDLLAHLRAHVSGFVSYEHVLSGAGLPRVYAFLRDQQPRAESPDVRRRLAEPGADAGRVIGDGATAGDYLCGATLALIAEVAAQFVADVALHENADVVVLCGGVAQKNPQWFTPHVLQRAFRQHGLKRDDLAHVEVGLLKERYSAVYGALAIARDGA